MEKQKGKKKLDKIKKNTSSIAPKNIIFTMGVLDLTFIIEFTDKDLLKANIEGIDNITRINQLDFIKDNEELIKSIKLKSENEIFNQLILLNKTSIKKKQVEFLAVFRPKFRENQYFEDVFDRVTKKYGIIVNKKSLNKKGHFSINFELKYKTVIQNFSYNEGDLESDNLIANEHFNSKSERSENMSIDNDDSEEQNEEGNKLLKILKTDFKKYDLMYINYNELKSIEEYLDADELAEVIKFFKSKGIKVFVNYYKPNATDLVEPPDDSDDFDLDDEDDDDDHNDSDKEEKEVEDNNDNPKDKTFSNQEFLKKLYDLSDIFFFDENQACKLFNKHFKTFSEKKGPNQIKNFKIHDYFISSIAGKTKGDKVGLFLKDLENFTIVNCSNKTGNYETIDSTLYPRKTTRNIELIKKYKSIIEQNKDEFYSIFCSLMIGAASDPSKRTEEEIKVEFINALSIIKQKLECSKTNIPFKERNLINFKKLKQNSILNRTYFSLKGRENGFVLDCMNKEKSKLKPYLALEDKNLKWFLSSKFNRKNLVEKGFIDKKGYIMYDKEYRDVLGPESTLKVNKKRNISLPKIIKDLSLKNKILKTQPNNIMMKKNRTQKKIPKLIY